jgi:predicted dehydrogenase
MRRESSPSPSSVTRRSFVQGTVAGLLTAASARRVWGANERVGVGFIGYGLIGKRHVLDFKEQPDVSSVAVAETHRGRLDEATALIGGNVQGYRDFRKLLESRDVEAVVVSTPDHWHALMTMMACAAGKDVYVEKPLTLFVQEGRWMIDVARRHQRVVQVGTQQRSGPHYRRAKELIQSGHIGKVASVRMAALRNIMPGYGTPPDQDPPPELDWEMLLGPAPAHKYNPNRAIYHFRWFWDYAGGQMTNLGQHSLDVVDWYQGGAWPLSVTSMGGRFSLRDNGETPDTQDALIEFPGWTAIWSHREACRGPVPSTGLEFFGPKGSLAISRSGFVVTADRKVEPVNTVPRFTGDHPTGGPVRVQDTDPPQFWTEAMKDESGNGAEQFRRHVRDFLDCVKSRRQPVSDLESGHRVATICHLANISLRLRRQVRWDAHKETIVGDAEAEKMLVRPYRAPWDAELQRLLKG